MSGLNFLTSEYILGLKASESGTFWYNGHGKLKTSSLGKRKCMWNGDSFHKLNFDDIQISESK
jgi:hypothetical protein